MENRDTIEPVGNSGMGNMPYPGSISTARPSQEPAGVNFLELLVRPVPYDYKLRKYLSKKVLPEALSYEVDDSHRFRSSVAYAKPAHSTLQSLSGSRSSSLREYIKRRQLVTEAEEAHLKGSLGPKPTDISYPVDIVEWEREIEDFSYNTADAFSQLSTDSPYRQSQQASPRSPREDDSWDENNDNENPTENSTPLLSRASQLNTSADSENGTSLVNNSVLIREYVNDLLSSNWESKVFDARLQSDHLSLFVDDPNLIFEKIEDKKKTKNKKKNVVEKVTRNKYNISNDKYYIAEGKKASLGTFGVQHSVVALRLDERFYRTNLSKEELRSFHRPRLLLNNQEYQLDMKNGKKKRIEPGAEQRPAMPEPPFKKGSELSLRDCSSFFIFEYSEEMPFFIADPGMVSLLNKYYRVSETGDEVSPEGCVVLENDEENPFFGYGDLRPGTTIQALTNNLFIAPVCAHKSSDYLCILCENSIVVRPIETVYLAGQELPKEEVFAPHSRKLNQFCKDRLKVAAHRLFSKGKPVLMSELDFMFPYFSEGSKRKWLKEYADCVKKGRDNVWILRESSHLLNEEDARKMVTPENICQYESMLACEAKMQMLGLQFSENEEEEAESGHFRPTWTLTRNFVAAANGRGLLELSRPDDENEPFFSFSRVKLRKGNETENRRILNEHQASYKDKIDKIWHRQMEFLSSSDIPAQRPQPSPMKSAAESETHNESTVLTIKRTYNEYGRVVERTEKIYDPKVIRAYLRAREKPTAEKKGNLTCSNCGQSGHMKTNKSCPNYTSILRNPKKKFVTDRRRAKGFLQESMNRLLTTFFSIPFSNAFHRPVSVKKFPNYLSIVKNPIDFSTIRTNVRNFKYKKFDEFVDEFRLMRDNCIAYNGPVHSLTEIAEAVYDQARAFYRENAEQIAEFETLILDEI